MPFRAKMKRALGRTSSSSTGSELTQTDTNKSSKSKKAKKEKPLDNVYKPGEPMPRPKYRGPFNQAHQDTLSAFSFGDMWNRRKSSVDGDISPMGSRIMSRRGSAWSRRSKLGSRQNSGGFADVEEEGEADDVVANVGLSRKHTAENRRPRAADTEITDLDTQRTIASGDTYGIDTHRTFTNGTNGRLFTADELATAMTQSTLKPSKREGGQEVAL